MILLFIGSTSLHGEYLNLRNASFGAYVQQRIQVVGNIKMCLWSLIDSPITEDDSLHNQHYANEVVRNIQEFGSHAIRATNTGIEALEKLKKLGFKITN